MYKKHHFHFVGISGIGMSGIAKILHKMGHTVSGCDLGNDTKNIQELIDAGCKISNQHNTNICHDASIDTIVYSSDVPYDSPELMHGRAQGIKTIQRATALAEILRTKSAIGVAGSHGKTTTSSMISHVLHYGQYDPTIIVGGIMHNINNNAYYGSGTYAVAETDESDKSHLLLPITLGVLTNIDYEHANVYKNIDEVINIFIKFLNQIPFYGKAIICLDDQNIASIAKQISSKIITYGTTEQADIQATDIQLHPDHSIFTVVDNRIQKSLGTVTILMPSIYNVLNATGALATALELEIPFDTIMQALACFKGIDRRFTYKGTMQNPTADIFDDYGHHPTEIYHSLITAARKTKNKLIVIFQPQRYTRTYHLWNEFINVFASADIDHLIITDIYSAHETAIDNISSQKLVQSIIDKNPYQKVSYIPYQNDLSEIKTHVLNIISDNDLILLLGAGKVNKLAQELL